MRNRRLRRSTSVWRGKVWVGWVISLAIIVFVVGMAAGYLAGQPVPPPELRGTATLVGRVDATGVAAGTDVWVRVNVSTGSAVQFSLRQFGDDRPDRFSVEFTARIDIRVTLTIAVNGTESDRGTLQLTGTAGFLDGTVFEFRFLGGSWYGRVLPR